MSTASRVRPVFTVTRVSRRGGHVQSSRYTMTVSTRPGQVSGPYSFGEIRRKLLVSALLDPATARNLVLDAWCAGTASAEGTITHITTDQEKTP